MGPNLSVIVSTPRPLLSATGEVVGVFPRQPAAKKARIVFPDTVVSTMPVASALPSKEQRARKDPFADAMPVLAEALDENDAKLLATKQAAAGNAWKAAHDEDAPRRARVLEMKGCLDGQCCYLAPGQMTAGPTVYDE